MASGSPTSLPSALSDLTRLYQDDESRNKENSKRGFEGPRVSAISSRCPHNNVCACTISAVHCNENGLEVTAKTYFHIFRFQVRVVAIGVKPTCDSYPSPIKIELNRFDLRSGIASAPYATRPSTTLFPPRWSYPILWFEWVG